MARTYNESIQLTARALADRLHGRKLAEPGYCLLAVLGNSDQGKLKSWKGDVNSWKFNHIDGRVIYFYGNPSTGNVEVRLTAWRNRVNPKLVLTTNEQITRWHRYGCQT